MADTRVFAQAVRNLEARLNAALKGGISYIAKFSGGFEDNIDPVFRRIFSAPPPENAESELESLRDLFRGFDRFSNPEKLTTLRICARRINAVASKFQSEHFSAVSSKLPHPPDVGAPVDLIRGVGPAVSSFLAKKGVRTLRDALFYFPLRYEDRRNIKGISSAVPNAWQTVAGRVTSAARTRRGFGVTLEEGGRSLELVWFHFDERYLRSRYKRGKLVLVSGDISADKRRGVFQILHPAADGIEVLDRQDEARGSPHINRIAPIYSLTEGLGQRRLRAIMKNVAAQSHLLDGILPQGCASGIVSLGSAVSEMHFPEKLPNPPDFSRVAWEAGCRDRDLPAPRTVAFFEFFLLRLAMEIEKNRRGEKGAPFKPDGDFSRRFAEGLPFGLTDAQKRAFSEIRKRMESSRRMNVLLQGDVGSGKTVIALQAMMKAADSGLQAAIMVPTQILAEQHAKFISLHSDPLGLKTVLLRGGEPAERLKSVESGDADFIVGTHALIQDRVKFSRLGLAVVDEQHKFGVAQREKLTGKGAPADILVMTATPIPRSLAMTVYGDLEAVVIDSLPPGRRQVKTLALGSGPSDRKKMTDMMRAEIESGRQCYVVCPFIDGGSGGDEIARVSLAAADLRKRLPGARISILHGRMTADEKESAMESFRAGDTQVLVSTTVVEVGVDVAAASLIAVENADRFGLSQLHQLRGRVGRGSFDSICLLMKSAEISGDGDRRLQALAQNSDGFSIAETDLAMRGPGEFLGTKQSGAPPLRFADLVMDSKILEQASSSAATLLERDPELAEHPELKRQALESLTRFRGCG